MTGSVQKGSAPSRGSHSSQPLPSPAAATATRREVADGELRDEIAAALRDALILGAAEADNATVASFPTQMGIIRGHADASSRSARDPLLVRLEG